MEDRIINYIANLPDVDTYSEEYIHNSFTRDSQRVSVSKKAVATIKSNVFGLSAVGMGFQFQEFKFTYNQYKYVVNYYRESSLTVIARSLV
jgi:hypothetical protein